MIKHRILSVLAIFILAFGAGLTIQSPALADGCTPNTICFFDGGLFGRNIESVNPCCVSVNQCHNMAVSARNLSDAVVNSTDNRWVIYTSVNCTGSALTIAAHSQRNLFNPFFNTVDSWKKLAVVLP